MKILLRIQKIPGARGQAIVEFSLVLMVLVVVLVGVLEGIPVPGVVGGPTVGGLDVLVLKVSRS